MQEELMVSMGTLLIGFGVGWVCSYFWQQKIVQKNESWWSHYKNQAR